MTYAAASDPSAVYFSGRSYHSAGAATANMTGAGTVAAFNKGNSPSFSDLIDIINPLQHIPIINTIYRQLTGDTESAAADIIGGALYGGPIGAASAMIDLGVHDATGKSTGDTIAALFTGKDAKDTMTAAADPKTGATTTPQTAAATMAANPPKILTSSITPMPSGAAAPAPAAAKAVTLAPASTTPTVLGQAAAAQPVALTPAMRPAVAVASAPLAAPAAAPANPKGAGPTAAGNYLVFGANAGPAANAKSDAEDDAGDAEAAPTAAVAMRSAPMTAKEFAVYGGNAAPGKALPATDDQTVASAAPAASNIPTGSVGATIRQRVFPVPPRNGPAVPLAVLPPPTTGPGALPGGKSQALSAQDLAVQQDPQHNFLTAYTQALDKYRNAQRLAASPIQPATSIVTGKPDPAPATVIDDGAAPVAAPADVTVH